ncbi:MULTISPECIES: 2-C-methyl-D-erythritol 4-phosphate cytidylyltransferase [Pseudobutyrivibrio]|uniref:2-C-methyl-D-erythritol 4-phosphate cytidylyltransferase n=1 Tax=Pseudobutyrivibrio xylanivorans TaxID=185007 RepID=A0A1G5S5D1_PSEXY|nr:MULTISPECIES: 2-C-methyl-D-erythritol 4-phosphate cytidylyltransferase [Pseudobutyrivibrio]MDC7280417.1 2-C-methyl-D-erythritol 4-phosphate cytidylyltransferase [Butyrivibrio fibrisolvens]SCZ81545.1 2-C-methyl-D-erythritol 4-phosphate cytidylyltransferase [Pseudobutyrivibrio xylanivorans]
MNKFTAIVLAAGSGKRMEQEIPKQYMRMGDAPLMVHCLRTFQESKVTQIVLVVAPGDVEKCRKEIIERYRITKCVAIVEGGEERYNSVYAGLKAIDDGYVLIHDCARAFVSIDIIHRCMSAVTLYESCVVGMPTKDTVKLTDDHRKVLDTPDRSNVWIVQTPQCFEYNLIRGAYDKIIASADTSITDDAMIVERATDHDVHMIPGSYSNIKVTTPDDIAFGEAILRNQRKI